MSKRETKDIALGDFEKGGTVGTTCTLRIIIIPIAFSLEKEMAIYSSVLAWKSSKDRGAWEATVCGVVKSWTRLSDKSITYYQNQTKTLQENSRSVPTVNIDI